MQYFHANGLAMPKKMDARQFAADPSYYPRTLFDTRSGVVREVFECRSGSTRRTAEADPKEYRSCPEPVPKLTRSAPEGSPNSIRRNRRFFDYFLNGLKAEIKYRFSKDIVRFTQRLRKIAEVPLMYRECTVSVRGVYRKGTGEVLKRYWRATKDLLNACTSGVDQRYSKSRRVVGVEAMTSKVTLCLTGILCFMLFNLSTAWAQSAEPRTAEGQILTGVIRSHINGLPIEKATILSKEDKKFSLTDGEGKFKILVGKNTGQIRVTSIGYRTIEINFDLSKSSNIEIFLDQEVNILEESLVVGYGKTTRRFNTGTVAKITAKDIESQPVGNPLAALRGRVPGLLISQNSGGNGAGFQVQIRGQNSFLQGSEPLFIIDGVPFSPGNSRLNQLNSSSGSGTNGMSPLQMINPNDIKSIEVLKDADATAIYGSRGANGVILITTKKAKEEKGVFDVAVYRGVSAPNRSMKMMGRDQYLQMRREAFKNDNIDPTVANAPDLLLWDTTRYTDFENLLIGNRPVLTDAQISYGKASERSNILIRAGYRDEGSTFSNKYGSERLNIHSIAETESSNQRFKISLSSSFSSSSNNLNVSDLSSYVNTIPTLKVYNGRDLNWEENGVDYYSIGYPNLNPLKFDYETYRGRFQNLNSNLTLNYRLPLNFNFKLSSGYNLVRNNETNTYPSTSINPFSGQLPSSYFGNRNVNSWIAEPQLTHHAEGKKIKIQSLIGATMQHVSSESEMIQAINYQSDLLLGSMAAAGDIYGNNNKDVYRYSGLYGRVTLNLRDRYIVNISGRRDGSSRFGPQTRFANFGAVGGAWLLSEETFFKSLTSVFSFAKVRGSYGVTGNDQIGNYRYLEIWEPQNNGNYQTLPTIRPTALFNPTFAWERNRKMEGALEIGALNNRIFIVANFYRNISDNQLVNYTLPNQTGFAYVLRNLDAEIQNSGLEVTIETKNIASKNLQWNTNFNIARNRNKLLSFPNLENSSYANSYIIGEPLSIMRSYRFLGVDPQNGLYLVDDFNNDGVLTQADRVVLTNLEPRFYGGIHNNLSYKRLQIDVGIDFRKQIGVNYLGNLGAVIPGYGLYNQPKIALERWQKPGDLTDIQRYTAGDPEALTAAYNMRQSDAIYSDASFLRLRSINVSCLLPDNWIRKFGLESIRIYGQAENIFTLTKYKGSDPETQNLLALPLMRTFTLGLNVKI